MAGDVPLVPMPNKRMRCGAPGALLAMVMAPVRAPVVVGEKVTPIVQVAPAERATQAVVRAKSPDAVTPLMVNEASPPFVMVIDFDPLVVLVACDPKLSSTVDIFRRAPTEPDTPVPVRRTACGLLTVPSPMVRLP